MSTSPRPRSAARAGRLALAPLLLLAACGSSSGGGDDGNRLAGTLTVVAGGGTILEAEPNDSADQAHFLGDLRPGDAVTVLGTSTDDGSDPFDGFEIHAAERTVFDVALATGSTGDFDLAVFDPVTLQVVESFQSGGTTESGRFVAQGTFFLVLYSFSGTDSYQLDIGLSAAPAVLPEAEPNDVSGDAQYLGELTVQQQIVIGGDLGGADVSDRVLVAVPEAITLDLSLLHDAGEDFDLVVSDATADVANPTPLATFGTADNPETGQVSIDAMSLIEIEVLPYLTSAGSYELTLGAGLGPAGDGPGGGLARLSAAPRGPDLAGPPRLRGPAAARSFATPRLEFVGGDVLVAARTPQDDARLDALLGRRGGRTEARVPDGVRRVRFDLPRGLDPAERARYTLALRASLAGRPELTYAEPNLILRPTALDTQPDDNFYNLQWHYALINLPAAWDLTTGDDSVVVAVIDTGSTPALDLVPRELPGIDLISDPDRARDGDGIDNDPLDEGDSDGFQSSSFHGSHVAGTIAASTDNGYGVAGVTWSTRVFHVRVLGVGGGALFDIVNGIRYAARLSNSSGQLPAVQADVMNMSLGGPGTSQAMQDAVTAARNAGTLVVAAAGNENSSGTFIPATLDDVISVSAVGFDGKKAPYSNFHPTVDIAAPGGDVSVDKNGDGHPDGVLSTKPDDTQNPTNYEVFAFYQGTSMAAPHVAGVAALVLAIDPGLTVPQLESILLGTTTDLGAPGRDDIYGEGLLDAFAAVQLAAGGGGGPLLGVSTTSLLFESREECSLVQVSNLGDGLLEVTDVAATTGSGGDWLSATRVPIQNGNKSDTSAVEVCVDAAGLADGVYGGQVVATSNGGSRTITVALALGQAGGGTPQTVFVLAVEIDLFETKGQVVLSTTGNLKYAFEDLPPGNYLVVAGTDADDDGFICDEGEPLCGVYPTLEQPAVLTVEKDSKLSGLSFPLLPGFGGASSEGAGFRLLDEPAPGAEPSVDDASVGADEKSRGPR